MTAKLRWAWLLCIGLAECAGPCTDPSQGGFVSGVQGLTSGCYAAAVQAREADLARLRQQQADAEAEAAHAKQVLAARRDSLSVLQGEANELDRSLVALQARAARLRAQNATDAGRNRQISGDLAAAKKRLVALQAELARQAPGGEYEATQREYESLQHSIDVLNQELRDMADQ